MTRGVYAKHELNSGSFVRVICGIIPGIYNIIPAKAGIQARFAKTNYNCIGRYLETRLVVSGGRGRID